MNVFQYAAVTEQNWVLNLKDTTDYEKKYTFYSDLSIAEFCEVYMRDRNAVKKTYKNVIANWGKDIEAITEFCMVLNHKSWAFADNVDSKYLCCGEGWKAKYTEIYTDLYYKCRDYIFDTYKDNADALDYFYRVTD